MNIQGIETQFTNEALGMFRCRECGGVFPSITTENALLAHWAIHAIQWIKDNMVKFIGAAGGVKAISEGRGCCPGCRAYDLRLAELNNRLDRAGVTKDVCLEDRIEVIITERDFALTQTMAANKRNTEAWIKVHAGLDALLSDANHFKQEYDK